jgi:ABC-type nitrate/sulfonate/bicarbonate transport system permease component
MEKVDPQPRSAVGITKDTPTGPAADAPSGPARQWRGVPRRSFWLGSLGVVLLLAAWELASVLEWINPSVWSKPTDIAVAAVEYFTTGTGWSDVRVSGLEFLYGFLLATAFGLLFGFAIGWWRWLDELTEPLVNFANASPRIALVPILITVFGIGITSKVAVVFLAAVFPILLNARSGVRQVDRSLVEVAQSFMASNLQMLRTVFIPASIPSVITGVRLGIGQGLVGMVVGELMASTAGLGFVINTAANQFRPDLAFVALFVVSGTGVLLSSLLKAVERRLDRWRPPVAG